jgi:hypothetical protein
MEKRGVHLEWVLRVGTVYPPPTGEGCVIALYEPAITGRGNVAQACMTPSSACAGVGRITPAAYCAGDDS